MTDRPTLSLLARLPPTRGRQRAGADLSRVTWFGVGGPAEALFRPEDADDLAAFLRGLPEDAPLTAIGVGSNLLVRDGGVRGVVVRLGRGFAEITVKGDEMICGAGALDASVAQAACNAGLEGLEFLCGIPGAIGGALRMNAGAYGREIKDVLVSCEALDRRGARHVLARGDMGLSYRHCAVPEDWIFIAARLRGVPGDRDIIAARMAEIKAQRQQSQPIGARTGGSTFANPPGRRAWTLIDDAGCRGLTVGGAQVSQRHCNFLLNTGAATANDLERLGETVRQRVLETSGVALRWEIRRIGEPAPAALPGDEP